MKEYEKRRETKRNEEKIRYLLFLFIVVLFCPGITVCAISPAENTIGNFYSTIQVKNALDELEDKNLNVYAGQELTIIKEKYENIGKIYYKLEDGNWTSDLPTFNEVGDHNVYYYVEGNDDYADLGSEENPMAVKVNVDVNRQLWGDRIENNTNGQQVVNYVNKDGMTSAEVTGNNIIWLKEESYGTSAWYGLDNRSGVFAKGSKFWVKWLSKENDKEEWDKYYEMLDESHKRQAEEGKLWIFLTGVTMPDGKTEYGQLNREVPFYIQLGDDWDKDDIQAVFIDTTEDDRIDDIKFMDPGQKSDFEIASINFPDTTGGYVRLMLKHFSPYAVYDKDDKSNYIEIQESIEQNEIDETDKNIQIKNTEGKNWNSIYNYNGSSSNNKENKENITLKVDNDERTKISKQETKEKEIESKKKSSSVKTGDETQTILLLALLAFSILMICCCRKKKKKLK